MLSTQIVALGKTTKLRYDDNKKKQHKDTRRIENPKFRRYSVLLVAANFHKNERIAKTNFRASFIGWSTMTNSPIARLLLFKQILHNRSNFSVRNRKRVILI